MPRNKLPMVDDGGEKVTSNQDVKHDPVTTKCTQICGETFRGKSCAKTVLVKVYSKGQPERSVKMYAMLDDQSNVSLARPNFFDLFEAGGDNVLHTLSSCAGTVETFGRRAMDFVIESLDSSASLELPSLIECNQIPNHREEIPTPEVARHHSHLVDIVGHIHPVDDILLLIGRDIVQAHHVFDQRIGTVNAPYAQKLCLGLVVVGETCLGKVHQPGRLTVNKTNILTNGRASIFNPCPNRFDMKQSYFGELMSFEVEQSERSIFEVTKDDEKPVSSIEDREFIQIMDNEMFKGTEGNWVAPLPFRSPRPSLPNNKPHVVKRAKTLDRSLRRDPMKRQHMVDFMQKVIENMQNLLLLSRTLQYAGTCPSLECTIRRNLTKFVLYLIRLLNMKALPSKACSSRDLTSQIALLGFPLISKREPVAIMGDVQQMFHCFNVHEDHRNYFRFLWYRENDPNNELVDYRMKVHLFGNSPSPAVATYGLRKTAEAGKEIYGEDVNDGLVSLPTAHQAIDLMTRTQHALHACGNLRLHKIASNNSSVLEAFPKDDRAKDLKDLSFERDSLPLQRTLGMAWDINSDTFTFRVTHEEKPFTKRGVLPQ